MSWTPPENAAEAVVTRYELAAWPTYRSEPSAAADVSIGGGRLDHTVEDVGPGCQFRARVRAVGANGAGGYARLPPTRLSDEVCDGLRPPAPRGVTVKLTPGAETRFVDGRYVRSVDVAWRHPSPEGVTGHRVRFSMVGTDSELLSTTSAPPPLSRELPAGSWRVEVWALDGEVESAQPGTARIVIRDPGVIVVGIRGITILPQEPSRIVDGCRRGRGERIGQAELWFSRPLAFPIGNVAIEPLDVHFLVPRSGEGHVAVPAGVSAYPLETWVDCGVHLGDAFTVRVSGVRAVDPANDRYLDIEGTGHRVVAGDQVPVPVLPAPAVLAMAAVLAAAGVLRRRRG